MPFSSSNTSFKATKRACIDSLWLLRVTRAVCALVPASLKYCARSLRVFADILTSYSACALSSAAISVTCSIDSLMTISLGILPCILP